MVLELCLIVFCLVGLFTVALYQRNLPYFPIEISRIAASSPECLSIFRLFAIITCPLFLFNHRNVTSLGLVLSLCVIAHYDDVKSWFAHMLGVSLLGLFVAIHALNTGKTHLLIIASCIYAVRLILKFAVIEFYEDLRQNETHTSRALDIMYGAGRVPYPLTLAVFRLGGFLQWIVFVYFYKILN